MNSPSLKYYFDYNKIIIKPKIFFETSKPKSNFFIFEWVEYTSYFRKMNEVLDYYIIKCLIKNYYSTKKFTSARELISKIVKNLNYFVYDKIHYDYFFNFDDTIHRFKYLEKIILDSNLFSDIKKKQFINYLISSLDILQEIIIIFDQNNILNNNSYKRNPFNFNDRIQLLNFVPFAGGTINNKKINSFWVTDMCISNYHYLQFIKNNGYLKKSLWSEDGYNWVNANSIYKPKNWKFINNEWFIGTIPIEEVYNLPVEHISYYEAEACANYYKCRLPTEDEWEWMATNRNKTKFPNGIDLPLFFELSINFSSVEAVNGQGCKSLMGLYQMFGNTWELTSSLKIDNDQIEVCLKGGDRNVPTFILNSKLKMYIERYSNDFLTSFRMIKK